MLPPLPRYLLFCTDAASNSSKVFVNFYFVALPFFHNNGSIYWQRYLRVKIFEKIECIFRKLPSVCQYTSRVERSSESKCSCVPASESN